MFESRSQPQPSYTKYSACYHCTDLASTPTKVTLVDGAGSKLSTLILTQPVAGSATTGWSAMPASSNSTLAGFVRKLSSSATALPL
ncbi:MAG: hypothetical protein Q9219_006161 [cf. Caloplaca sp. 3 TL-2023]